MNNAERVINFLCGRKGFGDWWDDIRSVNKAEISRGIENVIQLDDSALKAQLTETQKELEEARSACRLAHSALDDLMGDSDLENDESSEMKACQALARVIAKGTV